MLPQYLMSLTKHNNNTTTLSLHNRAFVEPPLRSPLEGISGYTSVYAAARRPVDVSNLQCTTAINSATPPGIAQGCRLLHPLRTIRIPDYDKMRNICPDEWVKELRNPSIVLAVPGKFAMPLPTRPKEVNRENISAIVDHDWEYRASEVQLVITERITAIEDHSIDRDGLAPRPEDVLGCMVHYALASQGYRSGPKNTYVDERSPPLPPSPSHIQWLSRSSPTGAPSLSETSSAVKTPVTAASQGNGRPARHCDWIDCPYCPMLAQNELSGVAGASNWQSAFTTRSAKSRTSHRELRKATNQCTKTQTPGCGKKNVTGIRTNLTRKTAGGAPGAADQGSANGGRGIDAKEEYWQVASLLGLVRRA